MSEYICENKSTKISKIIFNIRAGTLDLKVLKPWKYEDNLCVMCNVKEENIEHFMKCEKYNGKETGWQDIHGNDPEKQFYIGKEAYSRLKTRENKIEEDGQGSLPAPTAPSIVLLC